MFKWDPAEYQENSTNQKKWGEEIVNSLKLQSGEKVLDIGCGVGNITVMIARKIPQGYIIGIDSSPEMINQAKLNYPRTNFPNLSFQLMDACNLNFSEEFDAVFSNATLHWIKDHKPVLEGICRALHSGGRIVMQMGGKDNASDILETFEGIMNRPAWSKYFRNFTFSYGFYGPEKYHQWLKQTGLRPFRVELVPKDMVHENPDKFASWVRTTWLPYTQSVPEELREGLIRELVAEYINNHPLDEKGFVHIKMVRLEVEAFKP